MSVNLTNAEAAIKQNPFAAACGAIVVLFIVILTLRQDIPAKLELATSRAKDLLGKNQQNIVNAVQLPEQTEALRRINLKIREAALAPLELPRNLNYFYALEARAGVKLVEVQQQPLPQPASPAKGVKPYYVPLAFRLTLTGSYIQIMRYLAGIEATFVVSDLSSAVLTRAPGDLGADALPIRTATIELWVLASNT